MATAQPTPLPSNPTTDGEETPPTTNQQTQEPVDPSEGATGTAKLTAPATSETATDLLILGPSESTDINIGLIVGTAAAGIVGIILTLAVVIFIAVLLKKHVQKAKTKKKEGYSVQNTAAVPTMTNQAYVLTHHDRGKSGVEENIYNLPEVADPDTIEAKQNEAYVTCTHTNVTTEGNQAYGISNANIATGIHSVYEPVETADEYDYI